MERRIEILGGYDLTRPEPQRNYGVCACKIFFYVIGPEGAVQFLLYTDWYPEASQHRLRNAPHILAQPQPLDIGYHSKKPRYEGQDPRENCSVIGCTCYYDGSGLYAEEWVEGFRHGGTEWLWPRLEQYYRHIFEGGALPDLTPIPKKHPNEKEPTP
jgi:hypothetical protein